MALAAFAAPILPGKTEQWHRFADDLMGSRRSEYMASRSKLGVWERAFLQTTPLGDIVIVTLESSDPVAALKGFASGTDEFTRWFVQQVKEIHGFDLADMAKMPLPKLLLDSQGTRSMGV